MKRNKFFAGNWKMEKNTEESRAFLRHFFKLLSQDKETSEYVIFPQSALLGTVQAVWEEESPSIAFSWGAQNTYWETRGAFTGELSPLLAKELGCSYVLAGHSERRKHFGESNEMVARRALGAHRNGLKAVFCLGETLEEREGGEVFLTLESQCRDFFSLSPTCPKGFILAYEPVWSIGTGKTATAEQAEEVHAYLRSLLQKVWGEGAACATRIIYGGSVKPQNSAKLMACPNIDGLLVGGASLEPESFFDIAVQAKQC